MNATSYLLLSAILMVLPATASAQTLPRKPVVRSAALTDAEIHRRVHHDLPALGSLSVGLAHRGALINAVQMREGRNWILIDPERAWATQETVNYLTAAIDKTYQQFPDSLPLYIGHLSRMHGGPFARHRSHQSGRDVDISFFYIPDRHAWYRRATSHTLDRARTWAFLRALLTETDVDMVFINYSVQKLLKRYALSIGEDRHWLNRVFQFRSAGPEPIIRHVAGHDTHMHVRFFNPQAQEVARRAHLALGEVGMVHARSYLQYRARRGDSLRRLARRFGTTVTALRHINRLSSHQLTAGQVYLVPRKGKLAPPSRRDFPARRLPPYGPQRRTAAIASRQVPPNTSPAPSGRTADTALEGDIMTAQAPRRRGLMPAEKKLFGMPSAP